MLQQGAVRTPPTLSLEADTAIITLTRPTSLDSVGRHELLKLIKTTDAHPELRSLIITASHPEAFLVDVNELADMSPSDASTYSQTGHRLANVLSELPFPVIAAIEGAALGGGCEVMLACDLVIASKNATFGQIEAMGGVMPGFGGTWRLARRVGFQRACELMFTGSVIDATMALAYGLVLEVVPVGDALHTAKALASRVTPTRQASVAAIKQALNSGWGQLPSKADEIEETLFANLFGSEQSARMHDYLNQQGKETAPHE